MPIDLGLSRVSKLLHHLGNPHISAYKSIHIAGTNGKGSTIAYISSILTHSKIKNGRFTSPHMLYYNDCIAINNEVYPLAKFKQVHDLVQKGNSILQLGCTEFELLTVTAFKIFELEQVELAIIEVGLGGRLDATNALEPYENGKRRGGVIVTGITKIGIDHENLLGNTLSAIAFEKAGIMKKFIPCVVDRTNDKEVMSVVKKKSEETNSELYFVDGLRDPEPYNKTDFPIREIESLLRLSPLEGDYQIQNLSIALKLIELVKQQNHQPLKNANGKSKITRESIRLGIQNTKWHGRLQSINIPKNGLSLLLDGAHNENAALELGKYLQRFRVNDKGIIFVIALTKGKSVDNLLKHITNKEKDTIITTTFTPPDQMSWIKSFDAKELQKIAKHYVDHVDETVVGQDIGKVLDYVHELTLKGDNRKVVVCGSLYLCADVLRYLEAS